MLTFLTAGGWLVWPILFCALLAMVIIIERFVTLKRDRIAPQNLLADVWAAIRNNQLNSEKMRELRQSSPLGYILAAGLSNARMSREMMKESIEEAANHAVHELERYLDALGTIAIITPLLGLLGTVIGMIKVFAVIMQQGAGNANVLAGGISEALITTAAGLSVAIPVVIFHRMLQRRVDDLVVEMEQDAVKLVEVFHGNRANGENGNRGADETDSIDKQMA